MTIRTQNLLVIPPIFLAMGLAVAVLTQRAADEEVLWGIEEEALSIAVTVAELSAERAEAALVRQDALAEADLRSDLSALLRQGQLLSVVLVSRAGQGRLLGVHRHPAGAELESLLAPGEVAGIDGPRFLEELPRDWGPYPEAFAAVAPMRDARGTEARGAALVVIDATRFSATHEALRSGLFTLVGLLTSIGVLAALFLSARIGRQVRALREAGEVVASGQYARAVQVEGVKEVQDLSNTLGTMASILSDTLTRGRRALLVGDPKKLQERSVEAYRELRSDPLPWIDGAEIALARLGPAEAGAFWGWRIVGDEVVTWSGRIADEDAFEATVAAGAFERAFGRLVSVDAAPDEIRDLVEAFPLDTLQVARLSRANPNAPPRMERLVGEHPPAVVRDTIVLSTLRAPVEPLLDGPLALLGDLPLSEVAEQLPLALPGDVRGNLLLLRTRSLTPGVDP